MDRNEVIKRIQRHKLFAIIRGVPADQIADTVNALYESGVRLFEVTFDHRLGPDNTLHCLSVFKKMYDGHVCYGAGTVTSEEELSMAKNAGCQFIVSPDCNPYVIKKTREMDMVSIPAAVTPTECIAAHNAGADFIKLFPGGVFGPDYVKALTAPLSDMKFMVVGGVNENNIPDFYKAGAVGFGVGSSLVSNKLIANKQFERLLKTGMSFVNACNKLGE